MGNSTINWKQTQILDKRVNNQQTEIKGRNQTIIRSTSHDLQQILGLTINDVEQNQTKYRTSKSKNCLEILEGLEQWCNDKEYVVIGLCGGVCSGKTSLVEQLRYKLPNKVCCLSLDQFYRSVDNNRSEKVPVNVDWHNLKYQTNQLLDGKTKIVVESRQVVILEGTFIFYEQELRNMMDLKIYLDVDQDLRLSRIIYKDVCIECIKRYMEQIKPGFEKYVLGYKKYADIIIGDYRERYLGLMIVGQLGIEQVAIQASVLIVLLSRTKQGKIMIVDRYDCSYIYQQKIWELKDQIQYLVGRKNKHTIDNFILIDEPSVSRKHLSIESANDQIQVVDLDSANGTFIGCKIVQKNQKYIFQKDQKVVIKLAETEQPLTLCYRDANRQQSRSRSRSRSKSRSRSRSKSRSRSRDNDKQDKKNNIVQQNNQITDKRKLLWQKKEGTNKYQIQEMDVDDEQKQKFMKLMGFNKNKINQKDEAKNYNKVNQDLENMFDQNRFRMNRQGGLGYKE